MSAECVRDGSPVGDGGYLCGSCGKRLAQKLAQLAWHTEDVAAAVARQRGEGQKLVAYETKPAELSIKEGQQWGLRGARRAHWTPAAHPIPLDESASNIGREVWDLATWAADRVAAGRAPTEPTSGKARGMLMLAAERVDVLRHDEAAGDLLESAEALVRAVSSLLDAPGRSGRARAYLGQCVCGSTLHAAQKATQAVCGRCGLEHEVEGLKAVVHEQAADRWADLKDAKEWVELVTGDYIPEGTLRSWLSRGLPRNAAGQVVIARLMQMQVNRLAQLSRSA